MKNKEGVVSAPVINIYQKETGLQKKHGGVFPVKVCTDSVKKRRGVGGLFVIQSAGETPTEWIGCAY